MECSYVEDMQPLRYAIDLASSPEGSKVIQEYRANAEFAAEHFGELVGKYAGQDIGILNRQVHLAVHPEDPEYHTKMEASTLSMFMMGCPTKN